MRLLFLGTRPSTFALRCFALLFFLLTGIAGAEPLAETEVLYLSGTGYGDERPWEFRLESDNGRRAGFWTHIPVPSHWQQEGFGSYEYGHDEGKKRDVGHYRHRFQVPETWQGRRIELIFDGVMTDTEVRVDGQLVGPRHQGGFYRFRYDVTPWLEAGGEHVLEVTVWQKSKNRSVEKAEREADYWVFGGIYRPVWLRASPESSIDHVAIDARHDGLMKARIRLAGARPGDRVEATVLTDAGPDSGREIGSFEAALASSSSGSDESGSDQSSSSQTVVLEGSMESVAAWSAETPVLHRLRLDLKRGDELLHRHIERFGFRTVELRSGPETKDHGLFVNGQRVLLRGINRHAFWPASGRTLNRALDRRDVQRMKALNFNAVRLSHYPPDKSFLEACDEMGLFVLNELAGWHDAYGTKVGRILVRELVERDVNHPSILFWNNGNEDGWNKRLDREFAKHDVQERMVLHPRGVHGPVQSKHYSTWQEWLWSLDSDDPFREDQSDPPGDFFIATEELHGLYDGGSGAGLADYWTEMRRSKRALGLFLWVFTDEAIERTDLGRQLDVDGNHAPDGVLGPYREASGNVVAVRDVFSPIGLISSALDLTSAPGVLRLELENRFDHLDLSRATLEWSLEDHAGMVQASGTRRLPAASPGEQIELGLPLGAEGNPGVDAQVLRLRAQIDDSAGPIFGPASEREPIFERDVVLGWPRVFGDAGTAPADLRIDEGESTIRLLSGEETGVEIDRDLQGVVLLAPGRRLELGAPRLSLPDGCSFPPALEPEIVTSIDGAGASAEVRFGGGCLWRYRWTVLPGGQIRLDWDLRTHSASHAGVVLPMEPERVLSIDWLGEGPARQWGNRLHGRWGRFTKRHSDDPGLHWAHEPKFRGYYRLASGELETTDGSLAVATSSRDLFFGLFRPDIPEDSIRAFSEVHGPEGLAFMHRIAPIGSKQATAEEQQPGGWPPRSSKAPYEALEGEVFLSLVERP